MLQWFKGIPARVKESLTWLSVQVSFAWGAVWVIYSQLPSDVMTQLAEHKIGWFNVPTWVGIAQVVSTYIARLKKAKPA
jgi:hypothetical protein